MCMRRTCWAMGGRRSPDVNYSISMEEAAVVQFMQAMHLTRADVGGLVDGRMDCDEAGAGSSGDGGPAGGLRQRGDLFSGDVWAGSVYADAMWPGCGGWLAMLTPKPVRYAGLCGARLRCGSCEGNAWVIRRSMTAMTNGRDLLDFRLNNMQRPTLIVWGAQDELIPLSSGETMHQEHSALGAECDGGLRASGSGGVLEAGGRGYGGVSAGRAADAGRREDLSGRRIRFRRASRAATGRRRAGAGRCGRGRGERTGGPSRWCFAGGCRAWG